MSLKSHNSTGEPADGIAVAGRPGVQHDIVLAQREALGGQAIKVIGILVGFYALALLTVVLRVVEPFLVASELYVFRGYLIVGCYGLAILIVVAVAPRRDRFVPPGPRLDPAGQPRLFELISAVAQRTGQEMPAEVYLITG